MAESVRQTGDIEARMRAGLADLTPSERQAATYILSHFPMSALGSINSLARAAEVSAPTVMRLVQKLGFKGWSDYQAELRVGVERLLVAPLSQSGLDAGPQVSPLKGYAAQVVSNIEATLAQISPEDFSGTAELLADSKRRVLLMGGRLTHALADYMASLLRVIRPDVALIADLQTDWQQALIDLHPGDVVVIFDIRRYEGNAIQFADLARQAGGEVILLTDHWMSPVMAHARYCLACHTSMQAAWDSTATIMMVVEALVAQVQGHLAEEVQDRLNRLEDLFARSRVFRAPKMSN